MEVFVSIFNLLKLIEVYFEGGGHICLNGDSRVRRKDSFAIDGVALCFNMDVAHTTCCYFV